jgi:hypothetical protein
MANYCTEDDLEKIRPNIMQLGVDGWDDQLAEATDIINRAIEARWYRASAREYSLDYRETPFDPTKLLSAASQLTRLGVYKALELAYMYVQKDKGGEEGDPFERQAANFRKLYTTELSEVLASGLDYDWSASGDLDYTEKKRPAVRRLARC